MSTGYEPELLPPYPPFRDPEDWRDGSPHGAVDVRVAILVDDAKRDHISKHKHRVHPWCPACELRQDGKELPVDEDTATAAVSTCQWRADRYLTLHRNPPPDIYDPADDEAATSLDDAFLYLDELDDLPIPEPLIAGVLDRHTYAILRGRDGTYKSFTALDWCLSIAAGIPWQGRHAERGRALYVAGEGAYGLAQRVDAWKAAHPGVHLDPEAFAVRTSALNLYRPGPAFEHLVTKWAPGFDLVVLDTLRRVSGGADGNGSDMGVVVDNIDRLRRATSNGTVLAVAHTDKSDSDTRGFSGIEDDADTVWHARRDDELLTLENTKMKDGPQGARIELRVQPVKESLVLVAGHGLAGILDASRQERAILAALDEVFPITGATASDLINKTGYAKSTFYRAVNALLSAGAIVKRGQRYHCAETPSPKGFGTNPEVSPNESHEAAAV